MYRNESGQTISAQLADPATGAAVTTGTTNVYWEGDGGAQSIIGQATHEGQGSWSYTPSQANTNYAHIKATFVNAGAVSVGINIYTRQLGSEGEGKLNEGAKQLFPFTVGSGVTSTSIPTDITGLPYTNSNHFEGAVVLINQERRRVNASSGSPVVLSTEEFQSVPAQNDVGVIT